MQQDNSQRELPTRDYTGVVNIGGKDLNCAVLSDGTRVLTASSVFKAFGRPRRGKSSGDQRAANMPSFIDANNLKPFTDAVFGCGSEFDMEVQFTPKNGTRIYTGYKAEILPLICDVYLQARDAGVLTDYKSDESLVFKPFFRCCVVTA